MPLSWLTLELLLALIAFAVGATAAAHAVLNKRDVRAAAGWATITLTLPLLGTALYLLLGINRIQRLGSNLVAGRTRYRASLRDHTIDPSNPAPSPQGDLDTAALGQLVPLARSIETEVETPLLRGNAVTCFHYGAAAYDAMLAAIDAAQTSVVLCTYIFGNDPVGHDFRRALARAHARGVRVRVLIDAVGDRYTSPSIAGPLHQDGVPVSHFLRTRLPWRLPFFNLRNHRKLLIVDGTQAFTGGMNIRAGHRAAGDEAEAIDDVHFGITGPVVASLRQVFAEDWTFTTGEKLVGEAWFPPVSATGGVVARAIVDGPGEDFEHLRVALLSALACARERIRIVTPYFLPDAGLTTALGMAARRGVDVEILVPERNNLLLVQWAQNATIGRIAGLGCHVWLVPPPFDHSKLVLVDDRWALLGSANWDVRSLRLNFELNVECYDRQLTSHLHTVIDGKRQRARPLDPSTLDERPLLPRLRDGLSRLLSPYL